MAERISTDICVIGAGSGGLSVAAGAAQMGASVTLIEGGAMGGDCLNRGCVPSKSLLAAARRAQAHRSGAGFGVAAHEPQIDFAAVNDHVRAVIAAIAPHDSVERFEALGVRVIRAWGHFLSPDELQAGEAVIRARRFVIATGSSPLIPPIPGLSGAPHLTNESLFDLRAAPKRLIVVGGGPIGIEMAQAHRRLGSEVVVLEAFRALGAEDAETAAIALAALRAEGVEIVEGARVAEVLRAGAGADAGVTARLEGGESVDGSHLLVAAGRRPDLDRLDLAAANVAADGRGVTVDSGLRSVSNRRVYAVGDAAGGAQFTHLAGYHAGIVLRRALFRLPARVRTDHIPRVTFTDPELAQVGLTEQEARDRHGVGAEALRWSFADNDRARAERRTEGLIKAVVGRRGRILGASIVGPGAGELIQPWALAISAGLRIGAMAAHVAAYPTFGEVSKRVAGAHFTPKLFSRRTGRIVRFLAKFG